MKNPIKKLKLTIAFLLCFIMVSGYFGNISHAAASLDIQWSLSSNDRITFTWSKIDGASYYYLLVEDTVEKVAFAYESNLATTSFTCKYYIPPGNNYKVTVAAYSSAGAQITSQNKFFSIGSNYYDKPPGVPENVSATSTSTSATVSFSTVSGATGYDLLFNGTTYSMTGTSKEITGLSPKTSYTYSVRAKNASYVGSYSTAKTVTTLPAPLAVPANVTATATNNSATVSFSAVSGATSYDIQFNGTTYNVTGTSRVFTGLSAGTNYTYSVRAKNADTTSSYSTSKNITTLPNPPGVPTNVTATGTSNSATVSWTAVSGATSYDVLFNGTTYNVTGTSKEITGLSPKTNYTYSVRANNTGGSSAYSTSKTVTTLAAPLSVPTNVTATATVNSATVSFGAVTGATSYDILFNGTTYNVTGTSRAFTGLSANTSYTYSVRAKNADVTSSYSTTQTVTTLPNPPAVPTNVTATATVNSATVSWTAVSGATSYDVLFNGTTYNVTGTSKAITGLSANTNYTYQVRANNIGGSSAYSTAKTVTTLPAVPTVPTNVTASSTSNSATVSWSAVSGAASYDVLFNGTTYNVTGTSRTITGLSANTSYTYQVRANNVSGSSAYSTAKTVTTLPQAPAVPTNVTATATVNSATVSWTAVSGATKYDVLFNGTAYNVTGTTRSFTGLSSDTNYTYSVRANNAGGSSAYSTAKIVTTLPGPPAVPANVSAVTTENSATVSFSPVPGATSYDIIFNGVTRNVTGTNEIFTGLSPNTGYTYSVRANNAIGSSAYSATKTAKTTPNPPAGVNMAATEHSVTMSWSPVTGATGYTVLFNGVTHLVTGTSITFSDLSPGTGYTYSVRTNNEDGSSTYLVLQTIKTRSNPPDDINTDTTADSVTISFSPVPGATSYDILFDGTAYNVTDPSKTFTGLLPDKDYTYAVRANNESGPGQYGPTHTVRTPSQMPAVPSDVSAKSTLNDVTISWPGVDHATSYDINFNGKMINVTGTSQTFSGLKPNTEHNYSVRANNKTGSSDYSPVKTISTKISQKNGLPNTKPNLSGRESTPFRA